MISTQITRKYSQYLDDISTQITRKYSQYLDDY